MISVILNNYKSMISDSNSELISLWVGPASQHYAHHFYHLQAEQFFNEEEDPVSHHALWRDQNARVPRALIFDSQIGNLNRIREFDHTKMIEKMAKEAQELTINNPNFFNISLQKPTFAPQQVQTFEGANNNTKPKKQIPPVFANWQAQERNYVRINSQFHTGKQDYSLWQELFRRQAETYENRLRKQLQQTDYLRGFTMCADDSRAGFTNLLIDYLRDQCSKTPVFYTALQRQLQLNGISSLAQISQKVDIFVPIDQFVPQNQYFANPKSKMNNTLLCSSPDYSYVSHLVPLFHCLYTPLCLKESRVSDYVGTITSGLRNIFNAAYVLPFIPAKYSKKLVTLTFDQEKELQESKRFQQLTNIFCYSQLEQENLISFAANDVLKLQPKQGQWISQSYVMKGHGLDLNENLKPRSTSLLSVKYLEGIIAGPEDNSTSLQLEYSEVYRPKLGKEVINYPFHSVLFAHESFGEGIRKVALSMGNKHKEEMEEWGWRQKLLEIGDRYLEDKGNEVND